VHLVGQCIYGRPLQRAVRQVKGRNPRWILSFIGLNIPTSS
jgi:hypothetical protein